MDNKYTYDSLDYNTATSGGAIYNNAGSVSVNGYTFTNNAATSDGGAIYSKSTLDVTKCDFQSNKSDGDGGAIMLDTASGSGTVTASRFYDNSAVNGGALTNVNATLDIISCEMGTENSGNTATTNGGAIYVESGTVKLYLDNQYDFKSINYNTAVNGGAICVLGGTVSVEQYDFKNNSATNGGAIQSRAGLTVTGGNYESNSASSIGGAIYQLNSGNGMVNGATFYRNTATNSGGAIGCATSTLTMTDCAFVKDNEGNDADANGAVAYASGTGKISLLISDGTTRSCTATSTEYDNLDKYNRTIYVPRVQLLN